MNAPAKVYGVTNGGTVILYHQGETNHCPSCGQAQWHIGRNVAECLRCSAAIPLATPIAPDTETLPLDEERKAA